MGKRRLSSKQKANLKRGQKILALMRMGYTKAEARKKVGG